MKIIINPKKQFHFKWFLRLFMILMGVICTSILIIFYPQHYYFDNKIEYKNFQVCYDKKIPNEIYNILDSVNQKIQKSNCYSSKIKFKIFLRSDSKKYNIFPLQFPARGSGWTIPIIKNIFLYKSDISKNKSYNHLGHVRKLSSVLTHEIIHVLVEEKWFLKSRMAYFDNNSLSKFGSLWKEEGYAEYIAGGPYITLDEGLKILKNELKFNYKPHIEYFKYWFAIYYLIEKKRMTFEEILSANLKLDEVLNEAKSAENNY
jgi:hypothetical protein